MTNIALVVLDTLRKDRFDKYFDWIPGKRFDRAYSTADWTVPAHGTLFTGLYPSEVGVHSKYTMFDYPGQSLVEALSENNYTTRAFSANTNITGHFKFDRGFDQFFSPTEMEHLNNPSIVDWREFSKNTNYTGVTKLMNGLKMCFSANKNTIDSIKSGIRFKFGGGGGTKPGVKFGGTAEAIDKLSELNFGNQEFLFLNLMEAHEPYRAPQEYRTVPEPDLLKAVGDLQYGNEPVDSVPEAYDNCVEYLSDIYRELFENLVDDFDYVITVSDHGEMLGEHGMWGHEYGLHSMLTHVPFVISGPEIENSVVEKPVSLLDIYNTVADMAGVTEQAPRGRSLLHKTHSREFLTEYHGLTSWSLDSLRKSGYSNRIPDYDRKEIGIVLDNGYYYGTEDKMTDGEHDAGPEVTARVKTLIDDLEEREVENPNEIPEAVQDHLKDLGYV